MNLNIVFIGPLSFPLGFASTKRRRYIIDYLNEQKISAHVLCTKYKKKEIFHNEQQGVYGYTDYYDLTDWFCFSGLFKYYRNGKKMLQKWYDPAKKNVLVFHTILNLIDVPFFNYAKKLGYKIVFDQVETSYKAKGTKSSAKSQIKTFLDEIAGNKAYKKCDGSFVISKALENQNKKLYPQMPLCLLPNSTPILQEKKKECFSTPPKILYSGTYASKDGVEFLIKAFLKVQKEGIACKLILTGKGTDSDMKVLDLIKHNPDVEYKGMVSDDELLRIMLDCDILTMTRTNSKFANYGFPFKLSEYLATGNPVIATKVSDVSDILTHKENAYLANPEDIDGISDGIKYYINNEKNAIKIGEMGLNIMKTYFDKKAIGEKFCFFLLKI